MSGRKKSSVAAPHTVIYVGPTIPGVVTQGTTFNNGLPRALIAATEENAAIKNMLVTPECLPGVSKELQNRESAYSIFYKNIEEGVRE